MPQFLTVLECTIPFDFGAGGSKIKIDLGPNFFLGSPLLILVADDCVDTTTSLVRLLRLKGYEAESCNSGQHVVAMVERLKPSVVLLDLSMPVVDGFAIAAELHQRPELRPHCLIAVSGYGSPQDRARTKAAGFDHHLLKPMVFDELTSILNSRCNDVVGAVRR